MAFGRTGLRITGGYYTNQDPGNNIHIADNKFLGWRDPWTGGSGRAGGAHGPDNYRYNYFIVGLHTNDVRTPYSIENVIFERNMITNFEGGLDLTNCENVTIKNNLLVSPDDSGYTTFIGVSQDNQGRPMRGIKIIGNTLVHNGLLSADYENAFIRIVDFDDEPNLYGERHQDIQVKNNLFYSLHTAFSAVAFDQATNQDLAEYDVDNNIYYIPGKADGRIFRIGSLTYTVSSWQQLTGGDQSSSITNPGLLITPRVHVSGEPSSLQANIAEAEEYEEQLKLLEQSGAIDFGTNEYPIDLDEDYARNTRPQGAGYDIGAFEYLSGTSSSNGVDYYVCNCLPGADTDCVPGDDSHDGLSEATAWRTYERAFANFAHMQAGEVMAFCSGGSFRANGTLRWNNYNCRGENPCVIRDYTPSWGSGDEQRPLFTSEGNGFNLEDGGSSNVEEGYTFMNLRLKGSGTLRGFFLYNDVDYATFENIEISNFGIAIYSAGSSSTHNPGSNGINDNLVIRNCTLVNNSVMGFLGEGINVLIEDNHFQNNGKSANFDHNLYASDSVNLTIRGNDLYQSTLIEGKCQGASLVAHGVLSGVLIENNTIREDVGAAGPGCWGMGIDGGWTSPEEFKNMVIRGNKIINVGNMGIGCGSCYDSLIEDNVIIQENTFGTTAIKVPDREPWTGDALTTNISIRGNSIYFTSNSGNTGIYIGDNGTNHKIVDNAIYYTGTSSGWNCFDLNLPVSAYDTIDNNLCYYPNAAGEWEQGSGSLSSWQSATPFDDHSINQNPLFNDAANYDFTLNANSPLIDAGSGLYSSGFDILGVTRPQGSGYDIGAYEFASGNSSSQGGGGSAIHTFTGLMLDAQGWTDIPEIIANNGSYENSRIIYVSSSTGSDTTGRYYYKNSSEIGSNLLNPMQAIMPFATIGSAESLMRDGFSDVILLKRGDIWTETLEWDKSGVSQGERMIISAYGNENLERPKMEQFRINGGIVNNLIVSSIQLDQSSSTRCINIEAVTNHILFEDLLCGAGPGNGIVIQNTATEGQGGIDFLALRRNVIYGRYRPSGSTSYTQGMYINDAVNLLLEENTFDDNGHDEFDVPSSTQDLRSHNTYVMLGYGIGENHIWKNNIITRACSHGIQAGSGGLIEANLLVQNPIGIAGRSDNWYQGVSAVVKDNVVLHGIDIGSGNDKRGWGITVGNADGQIIKDNIVAGNNESGMPFGIYMGVELRGGVEMPVNNITLENNIIYEWNGLNTIDGEAIHIGSDPTNGIYITNVTLRNNKFHNTNAELRILQADSSEAIIISEENKFYGTRTSNEQFRVGSNNYDIEGYKTYYSDTSSISEQTVPTGDYGLLSYLNNISEVSSFESFYVNLHNQRKGDWDVRYTAIPIINFVRDTFGKDILSSTYTSEVQCQNGAIIQCQNQEGVCDGSTQTCTSNLWPGCVYSIIEGYEETEVSCNDGLDNDCNGQIDECAVSVEDGDNDGVPDDLDWCPRTPPALISRVNAHGCPLPYFNTAYFNHSLSTIFSSVENLSAVRNLRLGVANVGLIDFGDKAISVLRQNVGNYLEPLNLDAYVRIVRNNISVRSDTINELNTSAELTFYSTGLSNPRVLRDGTVDVTVEYIEYTENTQDLRVLVSGFSEYTLDEGVCGDSLCGYAEDCSSCANDCGSCPTTGGSTSSSSSSSSSSSGGPSGGSTTVETINLDDEKSHTLTFTMGKKFDLIIHDEIQRVELTKVINDVLTFTFTNLTKSVNTKEGMIYYIDLTGDEVEDVELAIIIGQTDYTMIIKKVIPATSQGSEESPAQTTGSEEAAKEETSNNKKYLLYIFLGALLVAVGLYLVTNQLLKKR